jgi:pimeloyl-ACP methyl ester carboxylesterase
MLEQFAVSSKDSVAISVEKSGFGPGLLLVDGAMVDGSIWASMQPSLSRHFTTYVLDRRGPGKSGDRAGYSLSDEGADLAAVVKAIDRPVTLVAHSYGAVVALAALEQLAGVSRLILYEPPVFEKPKARRHRQDLRGFLARARSRRPREGGSCFYARPGRRFASRYGGFSILSLEMGHGPRSCPYSAARGARRQYFRPGR